MWGDSLGARAAPRGGDTAAAAAGPRPEPAHAGVSVPAGQKELLQVRAPGRRHFS